MCNSADCGCVLFVCFSGLQGFTRNPQWFITIHNQHFRFDCLLMFIMSVGLSVWDGCRFFRRWWNSHTQGWMLAWCSQSHRCSKFCWIFVEPTKGQFGTISFHLISVSTFAATCSAFRICSRAVLLHTHVMLYSCVIAFYWRMQCSIIRSFRRKSSIQYPIFSSRFWRWTKTSLHRLCLLLCLFLNDALLFRAVEPGLVSWSVRALGVCIRSMTMTYKIVQEGHDWHDWHAHTCAKQIVWHVFQILKSERSTDYVIAPTLWYLFCQTTVCRFVLHISGQVAISFPSFVYNQMIYATYRLTVLVFVDKLDCLPLATVSSILRQGENSGHE